MYFHVHPVKVVLLDMGQVPKKVKYIRVAGDQIQDCYASLSENIQQVVNQETTAGEYFCYWMDYANDEIELRSIADFCLWLQFLEANKASRPEILVRPVFLVPSIPRPPFMHACFPMHMNINRPQFAIPHQQQQQQVAPQAIAPQQMPPHRIFSPAAPSFYPARYHPEGPRPTPPTVAPQVPPNVDVNQTPMNGHPTTPPMQQPCNLESNNGSSCESLDYDSYDRPHIPPRDKAYWDKNLKPVERACLQKFTDLGYMDQSGWLVQIIKQVEGDFDKACSIVQENGDDTDCTEN